MDVDEQEGGGGESAFHAARTHITHLSRPRPSLADRRRRFGGGKGGGITSILPKSARGMTDSHKMSAERLGQERILEGRFSFSYALIDYPRSMALISGEVEVVRSMLNPMR